MNRLHRKTSPVLHSLAVFCVCAALGRTPAAALLPPLETIPSETESVPADEPAGADIPALSASSRLPGIPEELSRHALLSCRKIGKAGTLTGQVNVLIVLLDDAESSWTDADISAILPSADSAAERLQKDAEDCGAALSLSFRFARAEISQAVDAKNRSLWLSDALRQAEYSGDPETDDMAVLFLLNRAGRSYACIDVGAGGPEYAVLYRCYSTDYRHEFLHLFGAADLYNDPALKAVGERYFPNSLMLVSSADSEIDPLTAYLIGWTDEPDETVTAFLAETLSEDGSSRGKTADAESDPFFTGIRTAPWSGGVYSGEWSDGVPNGFGVLTESNGSVYGGRFLYGIRQGTGTCSWADGTVYDGTWQNGDMDGTGICRWADGSSYTGGWRDDRPDGYGVMIWENGDRFEGSWTAGLRCGQGKLDYAAGGSYDGNWLDDEFSGFGVFCYTDGSVYAGEWQHSLREGAGVMTRPNGVVLDGFWSEGVFLP